jgi:hypothetical protein
MSKPRVNKTELKKIQKYGSFTKNDIEKLAKEYGIKPIDFKLEHFLEMAENFYGEFINDRFKE